MLSSITPLGERGRGNRWALTAAAYVVASAAGGLLAGAVLGLAGLALRIAAHPPAAAVFYVIAVVCLAALAVDLRGDAKAADDPAPGQRAVARRLPGLGVRGGFRLPARPRPRHHRHDGGGLRYGRAGGARRARRLSRGGDGDRGSVRIRRAPCRSSPSPVRATGRPCNAATAVCTPPRRAPAWRRPQCSEQSLSQRWRSP